jgi:hypothetical protein
MYPALQGLYQDGGSAGQFSMQQ